MSLEEDNVKFILDKYSIDERDRYRVLSTIALLVKERDKLISELNNKVLRNEMPNSLQQVYTKHDVNKSGKRKRRK